MRGRIMLFAVAALLAPATAHADKRIEAAASNRYTTPEVTMDQGERLTFLNNDFARHDVTATGLTSEGEPLFRTPLLGQNEEAFVEGSQYLTTGAYDFICSVHPEMVGRLTVTAAGTPVPRPGTSPTGDTTKPVIRASLRTRTVRDARKGFRLAVRSDEATTVTARVKNRKGTTLASVRFSHAGGNTVKAATAKLTSAGRRALKRNRSLKVTLNVRAKDGAGNLTTKNVSRTLSA